MSTLHIRKPTHSELETIEVELRLIYAKAGHVPKQVKAAGDDHALLSAAWRNEAARYFYLAVRKGYAITPASLSQMLSIPDGEM